MLVNITSGRQLDNWAADGHTHERDVIERQHVCHGDGHEAGDRGLSRPRHFHIDE